jgi:hypothetical protein
MRALPDLAHIDHAERVIISTLIAIISTLIAIISTLIVQPAPFPHLHRDSAAPLGHTRSLCAAYRQEFTVPAGYHAGRVQAVRFRYKTALRMERRLCTWQ